MPARPRQLLPKEPPTRPPGIPDGLWSFPRNVAEEARARGWYQADVAKHAGVSQSTVSRWMNYRGIEGWKIVDILRLEEAMGLAHGDLTLSSTALRALRRERPIHTVTHESVSPATATLVARIVSELGR